MGDMKKYSGSCHCGAVKFDAEADIQSVMECNCSICGRTGWRLAFVPATRFHLKSGNDELTDYQFGKMHLHHLFCSVCGVRPFSRGAAPDGTETVAVNVRCLEGVDPDAFEVKHFDGKSR
jgi:hypothetical protein